MAESADVLNPTLDLLIMKLLSWGPVHGYGLVKAMRQATDGALEIEDGALYPALHRLQARGWIRSEWGVSENNRKAKYYELTSDGRRQLRKEVSSWARISDAVWKIVNATEQPA